MHGMSMSCRWISIVSTQNDQIKSIGESIDIVTFQFGPAVPAFFGNVQWIRIFEHDSLLVTIHAFAESFDDIIVKVDLCAFHYLEYSISFFDDFIQDFFSLT